MTVQVNPLKQRPLEPILAELVKMGAQPNGALFIAMRDIMTRSDKTQTNNGEIQAQANVTGRTEQIGTTVSGLSSNGSINSTTKIVGRVEGIGFTVGQLNSTGQLLSTDQIAADGTGSPLTGGKRGFVALNSSFRMTTSSNQVPVSLNGAFPGGNPLTQHGVTTQIDVASWTMQFGSGLAGAPSGSVDPGILGTFYVYVDMPVLVLSLAPVTYFSTANVSDLTAGDGRICLGKITTAGGGGGTGSGTGGGGNTGVRVLI